MGRSTYNDDDREAFIANDEYWYRRQQRSGKSERAFVRANRDEITASMESTREGARRSHDDPSTGRYVGHSR